MEKPLITILTVNYNSALFIGQTLKILAQTTFNPYQVIVADNNSKPNDLHRLQTILKRHPEATLIKRKSQAKGSIAHGEALNELISMVQTPYFVILDADAVWVKKGWDTILLATLNDSIKIVGSQADGGGKPLDFPLVYGALLETETFQALQIDMRPQNIKLNQDTGFEMREKYLAAGYKGLVLTAKNTRTHKEGPFRDIIGVGEYYLNNQLMLTHFGRGSNPFGKNLSPIQIPIIRPLLTYFLYAYSRAKWFRTCSKVVDSQLQM